MRLLLLLVTVGVLAAPRGAETICLRAEFGSGQVAIRAAAVGDEVRLRFRHSLYGSQVEEQFRITTQGFQLIRLRYAERRLVEFYGHEAARDEGGWWVVEEDWPELRSLTLRASRESDLTLSVGPEGVPLWDPGEPGGSLRLAVTACDGGNDAR